MSPEAYYRTKLVDIVTGSKVIFCIFFTIIRACSLCVMSRVHRKFGSGVVWWCGQNQVVPHHTWTRRKVWFRRCLIVRTKSGSSPSYVNQALSDSADKIRWFPIIREPGVCSRWWLGSCSESTGKPFTRKRWHTASVSLFGKTAQPTSHCPARVSPSINFWTYVDWDFFCAFKRVLYSFMEPS
jgi:hypothetical protein